MCGRTGRDRTSAKAERAGEERGPERSEEAVGALRRVGELGNRMSAVWRWRIGGRDAEKHLQRGVACTVIEGSERSKNSLAGRSGKKLSLLRPDFGAGQLLLLTVTTCRTESGR